MSFYVHSVLQRDLKTIEAAHVCVVLDKTMHVCICMCVCACVCSYNFPVPKTFIDSDALVFPRNRERIMPLKRAFSLQILGH